MMFNGLGLIGVDLSKGCTRKQINSGMFGITRVPKKTTIWYNREILSNSKQKTNKMLRFEGYALYWET